MSIDDTGAYERLRQDLRDGTKSMDKVFIQLAVADDGLTAALVTMAALDTPIDRAASLVGKTEEAIDSHIALFKILITRSIAADRLRQRGLL